ncbi:hypothetical protein ACTFIU_009069 [Dictyostelium citrinum]
MVLRMLVNTNRVLYMVYNSTQGACHILNHLNITYCEELKELTKRIIRYLNKASELKFDIIHVIGEDNHIADMVSRDGTFNSTSEPEFFDRFKRGYSKLEGTNH